MKVLILGATGVTGRSTIPALLRAGHDVVGHARSAAKAEVVAGLGADPVLGNANDRDLLISWLRSVDAVVDLRVHVPAPRRAVLPFAWRAYARLRGTACGVLVDSAVAAGVSRIVRDTVTMVYVDGGDAVVTEATPVAATGTFAANLEAERHLDRFTASGGVGVVLRLGQLYGPDDTFSRYLLARARSGRSAVLGDAAGFSSALHTCDVGPAVASALTAPAGVYNVVDDEPLRRAELVDILAAAARRDRLRPGPVPRGRMWPPALAALGRSHRVSAARFTETTGWRPAVPSRRIGWPQAAAGSAPDATDRDEGVSR